MCCCISCGRAVLIKKSMPQNYERCLKRKSDAFRHCIAIRRWKERVIASILPQTQAEQFACTRALITVRRKAVAVAQAAVDAVVIHKTLAFVTLPAEDH